MISIKPLTPEDLQSFQKARLKALRESPTSFQMTYEEESQKPLDYWENWIRDMMAPNRNRVFVAGSKSEIIGMIFIFLKKNSAKLGGMWVDPLFRRQGIATALVGESLTWAHQNSAQRVTLWNREINTCAEKFYLKLGFKPTGKKKPAQYHPDLQVLEMEKKLN